ncbi:MAG: Bro-N domain-containing protein [Candidatus Omnitrophica bacterium]|nr:Bro-N domain-containing protein [Candidatus Omnitrophota bacterium]
MDTKIAIFKGQKVRKTIYKNEWWFVVEDVVVALTDTVNVKDYINKMRLRDEELAKGYGQIVHTLLVETAGGKQHMNCANTEGIFRIIQSIPSPNVEPFTLEEEIREMVKETEIDSPAFGGFTMTERGGSVGVK